ncbi:cardiomyopathy-associated protein 5 [Carassius gibelio]|uniref:cardiomyopathy-associated protein 5 n=1 Tax=Carassius gibelio TaxID=101364 RepID=UPI0022796AC9|nr:cardiomyopathy-associated protein 5 [Carassius gibelio]
MQPATKMETMEIMDPESQMTALLDDSLAEEQLNDEEEDLSNSLREVVQDGAVKPKLHCLMMDPSFSMVTVQSEDSGIVWETASSRCSTPWASELNEPGYSCCGSGAAGRILFIMDEELMSRRKRKPKSEKPKMLPQVSHEILAEAERPAMVEVSRPNVTPEEGTEEHKTADQREKNQRLFSLISEGSEILNIIAPPRVFTVDEEESRGLEDNLYYLEETPAVRSPEILDEPELDIYTDSVETEKSVSVIPEPGVQMPFLPIQVSRRGQTAEDYFEKFTLLDHQAPSGAAPAEEAQQETEDRFTEEDDKAVGPEAETRLSGVSSAVSMLDISAEHLDDVFYGGGSEPPSAASVCGKERQFSKSSLKESGSVLFGSEESVLTPIYLPEGPPKIIDPNLLEEPKALAFLYSDLYADAVGTRRKQDDDVESVTSEKSFHSQASDSEDRGYLEKFVLRAETLGEVVPEIRPEEPHDPFRLAGYEIHHKEEEVDTQTEEHEEITDFFRNSASSSPCEPDDFLQLEEEEKIEAVRTPRVTFKDETPKNKTEQQGSDHLALADDTDFSDEFLPVELSEDCPAWEENLQTVVRAAGKPTSTHTNELKPKPKSVSDKSSPAPTQAQNTARPMIPRHKPFLDLSPLLPVQTEDETHTPEKENTSSDASFSTEAAVSNQHCPIPKHPPDVTDSRRESRDDRNPTNLLHEERAEAHLSLADSLA